MDLHQRLVEACKEGNTDAVEKCLNEGADITCKTEHGNTFLTLSVRNTRMDVVKYLVQRGVYVNQPDSLGTAPLIRAVDRSSYEITKYLLENKANPNLQDRRKRTALYYASSNTYNQPRTVELLLRYGADPNLQDEDGNTPLLGRSIFPSLEIPKLLIENGAKIDIQNNRGETALIRAMRCGNIDIVQFLIEKKADLNLQNEDGNTALMLALIRNQKDMAHLLIEKGASIFIVNKQGQGINDYLHLLNPETRAVVEKKIEERGKGVKSATQKI